jgi:hypothetical protein
MKTLYKLTTQENTTYNNTKWIPGEWKKTLGAGFLCSNGWLHGYSDPLVASFMNPRHANITNPKLWKAEGRGKFKDDKGLKCGYSEMRIVKEIKFPKISMKKRVEIAIHCAIISGYDNEDFIAWALHWMDGSDRSVKAAAEAALAASAAAFYAAESAVAYAAWYAADTAIYATRAAYAAWSSVAAPAAHAVDHANLDLSELLHELCN